MTLKGVISKETGVSLAVAGAVALGLFAHFQWISDQFGSVNYNVQKLHTTIQGQIHEFDKRLSLVEADKPGAAQLADTLLNRLIELERQAERAEYQHREVLLRLQRANPGLKVPLDE